MIGYLATILALIALGDPIMRQFWSTNDSASF